ncbi:uncharacterized protein LOC123536628 [Mercenaria mercenaria]|uniref:uncharacterized protein LOC123536628 n=1 Tax=Mercenaria mercenaria TaxID=6596 RepID=UPI00234E54E4|nr:uncharacterized protein LOC123536628 [Mercenaria mercenaria]XP_053383560.1 uncharacterized protein LOC123536628 [Mercenaria mercenaria]
MDISLCVRLVLLNTSTIALVLQTVGLLGHSWFGFSFTVHTNGRKVTQQMHGGLLFFSPLEVCVENANGTNCKTSDQLPLTERRSFEATNQILSQSVFIQRGLVITGLTATSFGFIFLYLYLFMNKNFKKHRCIGITSAIFWTLAALPEYIAVGVQIFANMNMKNSMNVMALNQGELGIQLQGEFITPWAVIVLGVGASLAVTTGIIVAVTTCGKHVNKTVILYKKLPAGHNDKLQILERDSDDDDD